MESGSLSVKDRHKSKSSYQIYRQESSDNQCLEMPSHALSMQHIADKLPRNSSCDSQQDTARKTIAKREFHLPSRGTNISDGGTPRRDLPTGSVVYYSAEMELGARDDIKQYAAQVVSYRHLHTRCLNDTTCF